MIYIYYRVVFVAAENLLLNLVLPYDLFGMCKVNIWVTLLSDWVRSYLRIQGVGFLISLSSNQVNLIDSLMWHKTLKANANEGTSFSYL